jgi:hypothetical protein
MGDELLRLVKVGGQPHTPESEHRHIVDLFHINIIP